jgi:hypothetical protein
MSVTHSRSGFVASETPVDEIDGGHGLAWPAEALAGRQAGEALVAHDPSDLVVPDDDPRPKRSSACTRGAPQVPRDAVWTSRITSASQTRRMDRGDSGRVRHS